jgi:UDP-glucose 4-epimerase
MSILVTGGAGYIGSHLLLCLLEKNPNSDIIVVDNLCNSSISVINDIEDYLSVKIKFYNCDLRNSSELETIFVDNDIQYVIHLAALKSVNLSISNPLEYYDNNVNGTLSLLKVMEKYKCFNLIYSSSATVYGQVEKSPVAETTPLKSQTCPYGHTKLIVEQILQSLPISNNLWKIIALRYFNPVGAHHSYILGDFPVGTPENLMPYIVKVIAGELPHLTIYGKNYTTHDGTCIRDYIHIMDLVDGHIKALQYLDKMQIGFDVFNLGTGKGRSVMDIINLFKELGLPVNYVFGEKRGGDIAAIYSNVKKANNILGWESKFTLSDMCKSAWFAYKNKINCYKV